MTTATETSQTEVRACSGCRHFFVKESECRALPPAFHVTLGRVWARVGPDDFCGRFAPPVVTCTDAEIMTAFAQWSEVRDRAREDTSKTLFVAELMKRFGMRQRTAYARITQLLAAGLLGENREFKPIVLLPGNGVPQVAARLGGRPKSIEFSAVRPVIARLAPDIRHRQGFNALHRAVGTVRPISRGVWARMVADAVEDGSIIKHAEDGKYYVAQPAGETLDVAE